MATIPPWLNITPDQFLRAMQSGAALGAQIGSGRDAAREAGANMGLKLAQIRQAGMQQQAPLIQRGGGIPVRGGYTPPAALVAPPVATDDGFSADRLTYSVANDAGKMAGQAGAAEDARLAYNATLNHPDVNKELYPPVPSAAETADAKRRAWELEQRLTELRAVEKQKQALEAAKPEKPKEPIIRTVGRDLVEIGPSGTKVLHTAPQAGTGSGGSYVDEIERKYGVVPSGGSASKPNAPAAAIQYLKSNPQFADQFDAKYGEGSAATVLGE